MDRYFQYDWQPHPQVRHRFTTRKQGCSKGDFSSFNLSPYVQDKQWADNWSLLQQEIPYEVDIPHQVHGDNIRCFGATDDADGVFTDQVQQVCAEQIVYQYCYVINAL